jgi:hypothetical protein
MPSATKYTLIFGATTDPEIGSNQPIRVGGWSESHFRVAFDIVPSFELDFIQLRKALLPTTQFIQGVRVTTYNLVGPVMIQTGVRIFPMNVRGGTALACDIPQMALQINARASLPTLNTVVWDFRGLPDARVVGGAYAPIGRGQYPVQPYLDYLTENAWGWVGVDKTLLKVPVLGLTAMGVLTLAGGSGLAVDDIVQLFRVKADDGTKLNGKYRVSAVNGNAYTIEGAGGKVVTKPKGRARKASLVFIDYGPMQIKGVRTHKVGAPFDPYRGRRSPAR